MDSLERPGKMVAVILIHHRLMYEHHLFGWFRGDVLCCIDIGNTVVLVGLVHYQVVHVCVCRACHWPAMGNNIMPFSRAVLTAMIMSSRKYAHPSLACTQIIIIAVVVVLARTLCMCTLI